MIHQLNENVIGVEVPEGASYFFIGTDSKSYVNYGQLDIKIDEPLPSGSWQIVNLVSECSEEEARGVVERHRDQFGFDGYKNYEKEFNILEENWDTAKHSLHSFARSLSVPPQRLLIIKKNQLH